MDINIQSSDCNSIMSQYATCAIRSNLRALVGKSFPLKRLVGARRETPPGRSLANPPRQRDHDESSRQNTSEHGGLYPSTLSGGGGRGGGGAAGGFAFPGGGGARR